MRRAANSLLWPAKPAGRRTPVRCRAGRPRLSAGASPVTPRLRTLGEMKPVLADNGVEYLELEFLTAWLIESGDERRKAADLRRRLLVDSSSALEPYPIKVGMLCAIGKATGKFPFPGVSTRKGA